MADDKPKMPAPAPDARAPVADRGARVAGENDPSAAENAARLAEQVKPFTAEQIATPRADAADTRQMWIIVGPYRNSVLTMPNAEAEAAKDDHWAVEMSAMAPPYDASKPREHDHELTDEDRAHAIEAADAWAANVNKPPEPPPPEGGTRRQVNPAPAGGYKTK